MRVIVHDTENSGILLFNRIVILWLMSMHRIVVHYKKTTISANLIEVYDEPHTLDKRSLMIAIKFKAMS